MEHIQEHTASVIVLIFLIIVFLQSGFDKLVDWAGNLSWLKGHFSKTPFANFVPALLGILLLLELATGLICLIGLYYLIFLGETTPAFYGALLASVSLLMLLLGQRVAKDYEGAKTIVIYLIPTVFLVYLLQG